MSAFFVSFSRSARPPVRQCIISSLPSSSFPPSPLLRSLLHPLSLSLSPLSLSSPVASCAGESIKRQRRAAATTEGAVGEGARLACVRANLRQHHRLKESFYSDNEILTVELGVTLLSLPLCSIVSVPQDGRQLQNIVNMRGVPLVASSPVQHDSPVHHPIEVQTYRPPWKAFADYALHHDVDPNAPHFQHLVNQVRSDRCTTRAALPSKHAHTSTGSRGEGLVRQDKKAKEEKETATGDRRMISSCVCPANVSRNGDHGYTHTHSLSLTTGATLRVSVY